MRQYLQPLNPTKDERHKLLRNSLKEVDRLEDYENIIKLLGVPEDITSIAKEGEFKDIKIGIIGAGLAGLSSAFELRKLGCDITIFDPIEDRVGGRVYTHYFDKDKKYYGELGPMRIPISHDVTWHYINLFNLNTRPFIQYNENAYIYVRDTRVKNDPKGKNVMEKIYPQFNLREWERNTPWMELAEHGLVKPLYSIYPQNRKDILRIREKYNPQILYWDKLNIRQVLELSGLSQEAIDLLGRLMPLAGSFYYINYMEVLEEEYPLYFSYLYEIIGGFSHLPNAFYKSLSSQNPKEYDNSIKNIGKVKFKLGNYVSGIYRSNKHNKVILKFKDKTSSEFQEEFDYVVCAIPFSALRAVEIYPSFTNRKMQAIRELNYSNSQKTLFLCNRRFWEEDGIKGGGSYTDLPIASIWYPSDFNKDRGVLLASYNFNLESTRLGSLEDNIRFEEIKRQVEKVNGKRRGYLDDIVEDYKTIQWDTEPWFRGAFCRFTPEQKRIFSYSAASSEYNDRVFFAGEHISPNHGWMQGALSTGMKAANDIAKNIKKGLS
ncbi:flavin monoamine oxidase family protein [Alkalithermobacter paradoxus]|uniref:Flavin-dependent L-tryptophan oxidase RebO n=1 Tax=Alkalithermobacter paradoxus TaxID=29349 RepID=A0A1V4I685_9FIRM|nr:flavin-dependent L-tryptophan oxidase RebO precursor [[Clostridium] thermoalcaliphilum]